MAIPNEHRLRVRRNLLRETGMYEEEVDRFLNIAYYKNKEFRDCNQIGGLYGASAKDIAGKIFMFGKDEEVTLCLYCGVLRRSF